MRRPGHHRHPLSGRDSGQDRHHEGFLHGGARHMAIEVPQWHEGEQPRLMAYSPTVRRPAHRPHELISLSRFPSSFKDYKPSFRSLRFPTLSSNLEISHLSVSVLASRDLPPGRTSSRRCLRTYAFRPAEPSLFTEVLSMLSCGRPRPWRSHYEVILIALAARDV